MKLRLTFKTPDALLKAAREAAAIARENAVLEGRTDIEQERADKAFDDVMEVGELYIEYGEIVNLELDTETKSCTVLKNS